MPAVRAQGRRETDVSDTFLDSAWYYSATRRPSSRPGVGREAHQDMAPVTSYIGGNEHAVLHLLYSRLQMVLESWGRALRGAVPKPGRTGSYQGRREDVQVARQRGDSRLLHPAVGRRHLPHVPSCSSGPSGRRRLRETGIVGIRLLPGKVWPRRMRLRACQRNPGLPPDVARKLHQTIRKSPPIRKPRLQHGDRGDDGVRERLARCGMRDAESVEP